MSALRRLVRRDTALPQVIAAVGLLLVLGSGAVAAYPLLASTLARGPAIPLPPRLAGLELVDERRGADALAEIEQLHGQAFALREGVTGVYTRGDATLWVARAGSPAEAAGLVAAMGAAIARGRSPFTPLGARREGDRPVFALEGLQQRHFYFQAGDQVVWLASDSAHAEDALRDALAFYP